MIAVDAERGRISIDRTLSGNATFHARFPGRASVPIAKAEGRTKLRLLVDACSVEVFANDGQQVLTSLAFPSKAARALDLFGPDKGETFSALHVWTLASCWKAN